MRWIRLLAPLVWLGTGILPAADEPPKPEMRIYEVSDLTSLPTDQPGQDTSLLVRPVSNQNGCVFAPPTSFLTTALIGDMIRNRVYPKSWDPAQGTSIEERAGRLVVMQTPAAHAAIDRLLSDTRTLMMAQIFVQVLMVDVEPAALLPFLGKAGKTYSQEQVLDALKSGTLAGAPQLAMLNGQQSNQLSGVLRNYVADFDISGNSPDPVVRSMLEGTQVVARPRLLPARDKTALELRINTGVNAVIEDEKTVPDLMQRAEVDEREMHVELMCAGQGAWTLAGTLPSARTPEEGKPALTTLVFVKAGQTR